MSCCCGEPRNPNETPGQQVQLNQPWNGPITHQPAPHPPPGFPHALHQHPLGSTHGPPQPPPTAYVPSSAPTPTPPHWNAGSINSYTPLLDPNIVRPSPVHAQDFRASTVSPTLGPPSRTTSGMGQTGPPPTISQQTMDEGKMSVSIDFGRSSAPTAYISAHSGRRHNVFGSGA